MSREKQLTNLACLLVRAQPFENLSMYAVKQWVEVVGRGSWVWVNVVGKKKMFSPQKNKIEKSNRKKV